MKAFWITLVLAIGFSGIAYAQRNKKCPQTTVIMTVDSPIDSVFNYIVPIDLSHIFKRFKNLPGITNTSIKEDWIKPGLSRTIYFDHGSTSKESLLTVIPYTSFSYKNENFTSSLRFLAKAIDGSWLFTSLPNGQTKIEWTYKVIPKNFIARGLINLMLMKNVKGYLTNALAILKNDLEAKKNDRLKYN